MTGSPASVPARGAPRWRDEGRELARIRMRAGATQRAVAAALGVKRRTVSQWEQGRWRPRAEAVEQWRVACAEAAAWQVRAGRPGPGRRPTVVDPAELVRVRAETGAAVAWLATVLEVSSKTIRSWEMGQYAAPADMAGRWRDACVEAARLAELHGGRKAARR